MHQRSGSPGHDVMKLFRRKKDSTPSSPAPVAFVADPEILWAEVSSAIGAAEITLRTTGMEEDYRPPVIGISKRGQFSYREGEFERLLRVWWPTISEEMVERADKYLHSRVVQHIRHIAEATRLHGKGGRVSWKDQGKFVL